MAYTRLSESSSLEEEEASKYDKHRPSPAQLPRNITRLVSYKNLFGTCLGLWIITAVTLAWVLVHGSREQHSSNHAVGSFSFALGMLSLSLSLSRGCNRQYQYRYQ
ncbi:hypothetical protein ACJQWK_09790 [Exserohilum turcicum]